MSTRQKSLTKLQEQIIDALANDYEDVEQIRNLIDGSATASQLKMALWALIEEGYVACYAPLETEMKTINDPQRKQLGGYWFALSESGERMLSALRV